jgi:hypothetical protein
MRLPRWLGLAVVATMLLVACGDDGGSALDAVPAGGGGSTTTSNGGASGSGSGGVGASGFCSAGEKLAGASAAAGMAAFGAGGTAGSGDDVKSTLRQLDAYYKELAATVPSEIRAEFKVLADFWAEYSKVLAKYDYDFMKMAADPGAAGAFAKLEDSAEKLEAASEKIQTWFTRNCPGSGR